MKKVLIIMMLFIGTISMAQTSSTEDDILIDPMELPKEIRDKILADRKVKSSGIDIEVVSDWAGRGKEIGEGFAGALTAVKDVSIELADSDVGKFTMLVVAWKFMGTDALGFIMGLLIWLVSAFFVFKSYFKTCTPTKLSTKRESVLYFFSRGTEFETVDAQYSDGAGGLLHAVMFIIFTIMAGIIAF